MPHPKQAGMLKVTPFVSIFSESSRVAYRIPAASSFSEGYYRCNASNAAGWAVGQTYLDVKGE